MVIVDESFVGVDDLVVDVFGSVVDIGTNEDCVNDVAPV